MQTTKNVFRRLLGLITLLAGAALIADSSVAADLENFFTISVENASAKVGQKAAIVAKVTPKEGFRITGAYRNRIVKLSSFDDGVEFDHEVVRGSLQDGSLVFSVGVTPTKAGAHAVNGVFRVSVNNGQRIDIKSAPLIATVTGTE